MTYTLRGITAGAGACDHCGRTLARLFRITTPDGAEMVVGRVCSAKLTGYSWSVAQAERVERARLAAEKAHATYGEQWTRALDIAARTARIVETAGIAGDALAGMRQGNVSPAWVDGVLADASAWLARQAA